MQDFIDKFCDKSIIPSLADYVSIPNLSPQYDVEWKQNGLLDKACDHLINWIKQHPINGQQIKKLSIQGAPDAIHVTIPGKSDKTILFYGHYDKQPHFNGWKEGLHPTKPVIIDGRLYGRGAADDGYSAYAAITSILALIQENKDYPNCEMLFEGEEESGSQHLMEYFHKLNLKRVDMLVALDSGCGDYERLWLTASLRGSIKMDLSVKVLNEGVHSGDGSGIVPSCFTIIRQLLDRLEDPKTGRCHDQLFAVIPADRYAEALDSALLVKADFPLTCDKMHNSEIEQYLNRSWRPTISYTGMTGLPQAEVAGNVCLPEITLRLSIRLPPNKNANEAAAFIKNLLESNPPYNATVKANLVTAAQGLNVKSFTPKLIQTLHKSSKEFFGNQEMRLIHEGGSIPFLNQLNNCYPEAEFVILGVLGPQSNAHGPNEMLHISYMKGLIGCLARMVHEQLE